MGDEKFNLENFPTSKSALKMLSYVSDGFYDKSYVGKWLYEVMGLEYDEARELAEELPKQFFPETATWGLMYHEIKWGLPVRANLSYDERRQLIYQKRDYMAPMTPYSMEKYLADVTGFDVNIADINDPGEYNFVASHPNVFKVFFSGIGTLDSKEVHAVLDKLKQSHTTYSIDDRVQIYIKNYSSFKIHNIIFYIKCSLFNGVYSASKLRFFIHEKISNSATVIIRKNLWYLNGEVSLDGSRELNAMIKTEDL